MCSKSLVSSAKSLLALQEAKSLSISMGDEEVESCNSLSPAAGFVISMAGESR